LWVLVSPLNVKHLVDSIRRRFCFSVFSILHSIVEMRKLMCFYFPYDSDMGYNIKPMWYAMSKRVKRTEYGKH
jgi:hypothetical protein